MRKLELDLRQERFAVVSLARTSDLPWWVETSEFFSVTRTDTELSIVCDEAALPKSAVAVGGLRCLAVRGPLGLDEVGILSSLSRPLADAGIGIFTISSYDTDYVFVEDRTVAKAVEVLRDAGHTVHEE